ncbi:uncharacterized protein HKW66_Vig0183660 [Vigna angularis]|uniref:Aminotransferase-like plant mobile domain-containing protein n=1 Tax=Phaseolus angularis TaxID=3914 RepID=A0A8T0KS66_PHAAN|nr:uncharacterized protein HKW66_Vig0183660 [Vigna angularis]
MIFHVWESITGGAIYEYLVSSLCDVALCLRKRQKRSHFHVVGCVFALQIWVMEHVLFGQKKLAKRKSCLPRILHWIHVKVGEAEVEKAFFCNEIITEVYVTKEEMATEIVKEALDGHHNARVKQNYKRKSLADIVVENEALRAIIDYDMVVDAFGTTNSEEDYEVLLSSVGKSNSKKELQMQGDDVEKSNFEKVFDITPDGVVKSVHEESGDVLGNEEMDIEKSNMYTRLKAQPRKRVKSLALKTPWTRLDKKNARR